MKNKGRKHLKGIDSGRANNCGGYLTHITRPIQSMSSKGKASGRFSKKKWSKRVRGYLKLSNKNEYGI